MPTRFVPGMSRKLAAHLANSAAQKGHMEWFSGEMRRNVPQSGEKSSEKSYL